ncbi:MAG: hypothetical protein EOM64_07760 [Erysipelotrichia bacterium]|nr:hypothetical protein [Erysipelotrichia bacterium]
MTVCHHFSCYGWISVLLEFTIPILYMIGCWNNLQNYLKDGEFELTGKPDERTMKPFVTGTKNQLLANSTAEAKPVLSSAISQTAINRALGPYISLAAALNRMK